MARPIREESGASHFRSVGNKPATHRYSCPGGLAPRPQARHPAGLRGGQGGGSAGDRRKGRRRRDGPRMPRLLPLEIERPRPGLLARAGHRGWRVTLPAIILGVAIGTFFGLCVVFCVAVTHD
ncbi:MAG: hypothetical protein GY820_39420 [Gammaproteobacteria bacterium]|nr:hypothetical protein [Gammaproteobacteria bacterium]